MMIMDFPLILQKSNKANVLKVSLVMVCYHSNKNVTNTTSNTYIFKLFFMTLVYYSFLNHIIIPEYDDQITTN